MKFIIRFKIGNRLSKGSVYSLKDFCIAIVDRYGLTEKEICTIVTLHVFERFVNEDLEIKRVK
jgi:hypothetical protein